MAIESKPRTAQATASVRRPRRIALSLVTLAVQQAFAQAAPAPEPASETTTRVTITGSRGQQPVSLAGFGDVPLSLLPLSASVITRGQLADAGISSLGDITRLDAGINDAYNAPGYINQLAVRGFTLDNRSNYRRDGLPINAETAIHPGNKQALELIKGISGLQAGVSAPGGLVNLVVKRPTGSFRDLSLSWTQRQTVEASLDIGERFGDDQRFGWRVNASGAQLDPQTQASNGSRHLLAAAVDAQLGNTLLEAEIESSRQSQPSTPGFSLLGNQLPDPAGINPRTNLNQQAWTLPVVFNGVTGSLRLTHRVNEATQISGTVMRQTLSTQDRIAFPYGCSAEDAYFRYCADGSFDLYDFRSEGERRIAEAAQLKAETRQTWGGLTHRLSAGVMGSRQTATFNRQAYNYVGTGTIVGGFVTPSDPSLTDENTNRKERSTELHLQDAIEVNPDVTVWAGVRQTRLERQSVRTDGSRATDYPQSFTTPWLAASWQLQGQQANATGRASGSTLVYASWGEGVETEVAPNRLRYVNAGVALPALKSRQTELGLKHRQGPWELRVAAFDIERPAWSDVIVATGTVAQDNCTDTNRCVRTTDGRNHHRGLETEVEWRGTEVSLRASGMWLKTTREDSVSASLNGLRPTNVPERSLKAQAAWNPPALPGLSLLAFVSHEGPRMVLPDNSIATAGWTRLDLGARYNLQLAQRPSTLRINLDNITDRRAWQEAPYQFGHAFLYPLAPRTVRISLETRL